MRKFLSSGFFTFVFWTSLFFILFYFILWCTYDEILKTTFLVDKQINLRVDVHKKLEQLVAESKLISAKDYFGFYISYYNNFVLILSAIIGLFGISSFFYLKQKNDENMRDIENKTREEIKNYLSKGEVDVKKLTQQVVEEYTTSQIKEKLEIFEKDIDMLKKKLEQQEIQKSGNEKISL